MNGEQFSKHMEHMFARIRQTRTTKGREYANSDDQLANFKRLGEKLGLDPRKVLYVYLTKHLDSLDSWVKNADKTDAPPLSEPIDGRIMDAINYLILLYALNSELEGTSNHVLAGYGSEIRGIDHAFDEDARGACAKTLGSHPAGSAGPLGGVLQNR